MDKHPIGDEGNNSPSNFMLRILQWTACSISFRFGVGGGGVVLILLGP